MRNTGYIVDRSGDDMKSNGVVEMMERACGIELSLDEMSSSGWCYLISTVKR